MTLQNFEQFTSLGNDSMAALIKSGTMAVEGAQAMANAYSGLAQRSIKQTGVAMMAMAAVKTPEEFQLVTAVLARTALATASLEGRKLQELVRSVIVCVMAPLAGGARA
jgi:hypothetical protein